MSVPPGTLPPMMRIRPTTTRRTAIGAVGLSIVAVGLVLLPLPGPGTLIVAGGLTVLRREYPAAGRVLDRMSRVQRRLWPFKSRGCKTDPTE
jgi:hypothetical protein